MCACGQCSEKSPWLGRRLEVEINRKLRGNFKVDARLKALMD